MLVFDREKIEPLIAQCRFTEAAAALAMSHCNDGSPDDVRRLLAGLHALTGNEREVAKLVDPSLFACSSADDVAAHNDAAGGAGFPDELVGGIVLTWSGDANGAYQLLRRAFDRSLQDRRFHFAVAARERLAHHALLFGDVEVASNALDEAIAIASDHRLYDLLARCLIASARLALDKGDPACAVRRLERALAQKRSPAILALCAPIGAQLAAEEDDSAALRSWVSADVINTALHGDEPQPAMAATVAMLIAGAATQDELPTAIALRRALLAEESPTIAPELFSMAARYGDLMEGRLASRRLAAVAAPRRRYLRAHYLLARAYLSFRIGKHAARIDYASDAARTFNAMELRRWTNTAMLLMVRHEGGAARRAGRPSGAILTEREQQVADLIRRGARNREVALALQISEHTVERHVSSILGRLGLRSRWQLNDARSKNEH